MAKAAPTTQGDHGFAPAGHDHRACVNDALAAAEAVCAERRARLTPLRRRVLELVWENHKPVGAYTILESLQAGRRSGESTAARGPVAPPTVYRALDFLLANGLVHRIEGLNAYIGCCQPTARHTGQFLLCSACGMAAELDSDALAQVIGAEAERRGFAVRRFTVEVDGLCPDCRTGKAQDGT